MYIKYESVIGKYLPNKSIPGFRAYCDRIEQFHDTFNRHTNLLATGLVPMWIFCRGFRVDVFYQGDCQPWNCGRILRGIGLLLWPEKKSYFSLNLTSQWSENMTLWLMMETTTANLFIFHLNGRPFDYWFIAMPPVVLMLSKFQSQSCFPVMWW